MVKKHFYPPLYYEELKTEALSQGLPLKDVYVYAVDSLDYSVISKKCFKLFLNQMKMYPKNTDTEVQVLYFDSLGNRLKKNFIGCMTAEQELDFFEKFDEMNAEIVVDTTHNLFELPLWNLSDKRFLSSLKGKYHLYVVITWNRNEEFEKYYEVLRSKLEEKTNVELVIVSFYLPAEIFNRNKPIRKFIKEELMFE